MATSRRTILRSAAALTLTSLPSTTLRAASPPSGMTLGAQTHFSQGWALSWLKVARSVGVTQLRDGLSWSAIEVSKGVYKFDDFFVDYLKKARTDGISLLLTIVPRHPLYDQNQTAFSDEARSAFANYLSALADQFGDVINGIEVDNEINGGGAITGPAAQNKATSHVALLKSIWERVKPRHPDLLILGGSTNVIATGFLAQIFEAGGLHFMDGVAVHPYRSFAEHVDTELRAVTAAMQGHGPTRPLYATEFGDEFATPELASPHMMKMAALMATAGVTTSYWYALSDEKFFHNMGLFDSRQGLKPAAETFTLLQTDILPLGDPVRLPSDRMTFIFRYGAGRFVMWGAPRPITFHGQVRARDARGRVIPAPGQLAADPVLLDGDFTYTLGQSDIVADSFLEYGAAPWSYFARSPDGKDHPLQRMDWEWTSYIGGPGFRPLQINADGLSSAGLRPNFTRPVLRYTSSTEAHLNLLLSFDPRKDDEIALEILKNGQILRTIVVKGALAIDDLDVHLAPGDVLDFVAGPGPGTSGLGVSRYRVRMRRSA